jgi:hypothetical protein
MVIRLQDEDFEGNESDFSDENFEIETKEGEITISLIALIKEKIEEVSIWKGLNK